MKVDRYKVTCIEPTQEMIEAAYPILTKRAIDTPARARRAAHELFRAMWTIAPEPRSTGLTPNQSSVHVFLAEYIAEHGKSPTWYEIVAGSTVPSHSNLKYTIAALEKMGILRRAPKYTRNITLLVMPGEYVTPLMNKGRGKKNGT